MTCAPASESAGQGCGARVAHALETAQAPRSFRCRSYSELKSRFPGLIFIQQGSKMAPRSAASGVEPTPVKLEAKSAVESAAGNKKNWVPKEFEEEPAPQPGQDWNGSILGRGYPELPLYKRLDYLHIMILTLTPAIALYGLATVPLRKETAIWSFIYYFMTGLGITAGGCDRFPTRFACWPQFRQFHNRRNRGLLPATNRKWRSGDGQRGIAMQHSWRHWTLCGRSCVFSRSVFPDGGGISLGDVCVRLFENIISTFYDDTQRHRN